VNRWITRALGVLMLLFFMFIFMLMYRQLVAIQNMRKPAATSTRRCRVRGVSSTHQWRARRYPARDDIR
jgi:hypothetical protein